MNTPQSQHNVDAEIVEAAVASKATLQGATILAAAAFAMGAGTVYGKQYLDRTFREAPRQAASQKMQANLLRDLGVVTTTCNSLIARCLKNPTPCNFSTYEGGTGLRRLHVTEVVGEKEQSCTLSEDHENFDGSKRRLSAEFTIPHSDKTSRGNSQLVTQFGKTLSATAKWEFQTRNSEAECKKGKETDALICMLDNTESNGERTIHTGTIQKNEDNATIADLQLQMSAEFSRFYAEFEGIKKARQQNALSGLQTQIDRARAVRETIKDATKPNALTGKGNHRPFISRR